MAWWSFLFPGAASRNSAEQAKQRLQIVISHERAARATRALPDYLPALQKELQQVVARHLQVAPAEVAVRVGYPRRAPESLEVRIELPKAAQAAA